MTATLHGIGELTEIAATDDGGRVMGVLVFRVRVPLDVAREWAAHFATDVVIAVRPGTQESRPGVPR